MAKHNPISNLGKFAHPRGGNKREPSYEGTKADAVQDRRGEKSTGMSHKAYESSPRDKREDRAGQKRMKK